jgi:hypothetical protein
MVLIGAEPEAPDLRSMPYCCGSSHMIESRPMKRPLVRMSAAWSQIERSAFLG